MEYTGSGTEDDFTDSVSGGLVEEVGLCEIELCRILVVFVIWCVVNMKGRVTSRWRVGSYISGG